MRWAVIRDGVVANIIIWDGVTEFDHGADQLVSIDAPDRAMVGPRWTWDGVAFAPPPDEGDTQ
jgi:hypothetical protein